MNFLPPILLVDDEQDVLNVMKAHLEKDGYTIYTANGASEALQLLHQYNFGLVISDVIMKNINGMQLLDKIHITYPELPVVMLTAYGTIKAAVDAIHRGAYDYLTKPVNYEHLNLILNRALEKHRLMQRTHFLEQELERSYALHQNLIGTSPTMQEVFRLIEVISKSDVNVLIQGESGTGKELAARAIHYLSHRHNKNFIAVNCSVLTEDLLASELFGHEKGSFTGAIKQKLGRFELADRGTLFLDEVADIRPNLQVKLLRAVEQQCFERVGGTHTIYVDVRIIAATNANIKTLVKKGLFREDLYYRLNVLPLMMPPLRVRKDDIPLLVHHYLQKLANKANKQLPQLEAKVMKILLNHHWQGNVRELQNIIEYAFTISEGKTIKISHLPPTILEDRKKNLTLPPLGMTLAELEKYYMQATLCSTGGNRTKTAKLLGISRASLYQKLKRYNITN